MIELKTHFNSMNEYIFESLTQGYNFEILLIVIDSNY